MTTVLVLLDGTAYWSRWQGRHCIDHFEEVPDMNSVSGPASACPWLGLQALRVRVVLAQVDVDVVELPHVLPSAQWRTWPRRLLQAFRRGAVRQSLQYATCTVRDAWLDRLQEQGVRISCVLSTPQLLALTALSNHRHDTMLWVFRSVHIEQHVVVRDRQVQLVRTLPASSATQSAKTLVETLRWLRLETSDVVNGAVRTPKNVSATELPVQVCGVTAAEWPLFDAQLKAGDGLPALRIQRIPDALCQFLGQHTSQIPRLRVCALAAEGGLTGSRRQQDLRLWRRLQIVTAVTTLIALYTVGVASWHALESQRLKQQRETAALKAVPAPDAEQLTLAKRLDRLSATPPLDVPQILDAVAGAWAAHRHVELHRLSWRRNWGPDAATDDGPSVWLEPPQLQALPAENLVVSGASGKAADALMQLHGKVFGRSLSQQQERLLALVHALDTLPAVLDVRLMQGPMQIQRGVAQSSHDVESRRAPSDYRLMLTLISS